MYRYWKVVTILALFALLGVPAAMAEGNNVEFHGTVLGVNMQSATQGVLTLRIMGFQVPVKLTGDTAVEMHGDAVGLSKLDVGDFVKVHGVFAGSAITAKSIEIVDNGDGEFRLRGAITAVRLSAGGSIITLLGVDVLINSETKIERRGPDGGFTVANLAAGMIADTRGHSDDGKFVARHLKIGFREDDAIRVEFAGKITGVFSGKLTVDTEGGSTAVVLMTTGTVIVGIPAAGKFVEVRGTLNSNLEVVASRIIIRDRKDSDDDRPLPPAPVEFKKAIALTSIIPGIRGEAALEIEREDGKVEEELGIHVSHGSPNSEYRVRVEFGSAGFVDFGAFETNGEGSATVIYSSSPRESQRDLTSLLPSGKTVRDITMVQVWSNLIVVLQGRF